MAHPKTGVLIVEDEALLRIALLDTLEDQGFHVLEADTADKALDILASEPDIAIVFTDIDMPGKLDGIDLALHLNESHPHIAVVMTSGHARPPAGLDIDFLPKPYDFDAVVTTMRKIIRPTE